MRTTGWYIYNWLIGILGISLAILLTFPFESDRHILSVFDASSSFVIFPSLEYVFMIVAFFILLSSSTLLMSFQFHGYRFSMDTAVGLCCFFLFGPVITIWVMTVSVLLHALAILPRYGESVYIWSSKLVSNSGNRVLQIIIASWVYFGIGGSIPLKTITYHHGLFQQHLAAHFVDIEISLIPSFCLHVISYPHGEFYPYVYGWAPPLLAILTFFAVNNILILPSELMHNRQFKQFFNDMFGKDGFIYLAIFPISVIMSIMYVQTGFFPFLLFSIVMVAGSVIFKIMMETGMMLEKSVDELKTLNRLGRAMSSTMDLGRQFEKMYQECSRILPFETFFIALFQPEKNMFELKYLRENGELSGNKIIPLGEGFTSLAWKTKHSVILNNQDEIKQYDVGVSDDSIAEENINSVIYLPLIFKDEAIGVLSIQHTEPFKYSYEDATILATIANQAAISISNARLYKTAITEPLTRLWSRTYFFNSFDAQLKHCIEERKPLHLLVLDIDEFKALNDQEGHLLGDEVLRATAKIIAANIPDDAMPSRYGGDEFMVLLPFADREFALEIAETLRENIHQNPVSFNGQKFTVTVSIGISGTTGYENIEKETIVINADKGLYQAKSGGKNRVVVYPE